MQDANAIDEIKPSTIDQENSASEIEKLIINGRAVLEKEAAAIHALSLRINQQFAEACLLLLNCKGRIVVTGMGKSGHIGKKVAATFSSTGSPAFFMHPGEAKHGDMGMIKSEDVIIAISYSGETEEIISLLSTFKYLNSSVIALTGRPNSTLGRAANVCLDVSVGQEACPLGLAPTSSTTAALVMGDALAISLLQNRQFTAEAFALFHPGGTLGRRLRLKVDDIMHSGDAMPSVKEGVLLKNAFLEMSRKKLGMTIILNDNHDLLGIFTDGDLRRVLDKNLDIHTTFIHQVMSKSPKVIPIATLAMEALVIMKDYKITSLVVINEQQKPVGVVHMHSILQAGLI